MNPIERSEWWDAIERGNVHLIANLLEKNPSFLERNDNDHQSYSLNYACLYEQVQSVLALLLAGSDVNHQNENGKKTALMYASKNNQKEIVTLLLSFGADPNIQDDQGRTSLMIACSNGYYEIAKSLLDAGAAIDLSDNRGNTALMYATHTNHTLVINVLLSRSADINIKNESGSSSLMLARDRRYFHLVKIFLDANANINDLLQEARHVDTMVKHEEIYSHIEKCVHELTPENFRIWKKYRLQSLFK